MLWFDIALYGLQLETIECYIESFKLTLYSTLWLQVSMTQKWILQNEMVLYRTKLKLYRTKHPFYN